MESIIMVNGLSTTLMIVALQTASPMGARTDSLWLHDYGQAVGLATAADRMLLVYFHQDDTVIGQDTLSRQIQSSPPLRRLAEQHVMVHVPISHIATDGEQQFQLISHGAFAELGGRPGLAVVDFANRDSEHYGFVVSVYPFYLPNALSTAHLQSLLSLPPGSLTQRTMMLAVRIHPERPQSTTGSWSPALAEASRQHSSHMASIRRGGHHNWESRFHRINALLPGGHRSQEVCAESWPGQGLWEAAIDCVHCWRQSSGHWRAVSRWHSYFGYDMKRGRNGVWYATGIFSVN
jgi:hypothetical protein